MNKETLQKIIDSDVHGLLDIKNKRKSYADKFWYEYANHSMKATIDHLNDQVALGSVYAHVCKHWGRTIYLFLDGSSVQHLGWGRELRVVNIEFDVREFVA